MIRVFPSRNSCTPDDELVFIGDPPFPELIPEAKEVHVSVTFTWDIPEGKRLKRAWEQYLPTKIGGPAFDNPGGEFISGQYLKKGITITTRGCPGKCWFCYVPKREGKLRTLDIKPGYIIQDNNLLAAPKKHQQAVYKMLKEQNRKVSFMGGLDAAYMQDWIVEELKTIPIAQVFFAFDDWKNVPCLYKCRTMLRTLRRDQLRCYVLVGQRNDTPRKAIVRLRLAWDMGYLPFAMYYREENNRPPEGEWKKLVREWTRPAITKRINA